MPLRVQEGRKGPVGTPCKQSGQAGPPAGDAGITSGWRMNIVQITENVLESMNQEMWEVRSDRLATIWQELSAKAMINLMIKEECAMKKR